MPKRCGVIATPFGYGPAAAADLVAKELIIRGWECDFLGSQELQSVVSAGYRKKISITDERDADSLRPLLRGYDVVFASMNKVAIQVGADLGIHTAYFDTLAWMWESIPADHLIADTIIWPKLGNVEKKVFREIQDKVTIVPGILRNKTKRRGAEWDVLLDLGGITNPYQSDITNYARIIAGGVRRLKGVKVLVSVGKSFERGAKEVFGDSSVEVRFTPHDQQFHGMQSSRSYLNCGGRAGVTDALSLGLPLGVLLPTNLSQVAMGSLLEKYGVPRLSWESLGFPEKKLVALDEESAIKGIASWSAAVVNQRDLLKKAEDQVSKALSCSPPNGPVERLMADFGTGGAFVAAKSISSRVLQ